MPAIERDGATIYYEETGRGFPILTFAPAGLQSTIEVWSRPAAPINPLTELAKDYRVIAMDQRNAGGRSRAPITAQDGWPTYAADHIAVLDHLGRPRGDAPASERWANLAEVLALAKYPNVAMKATGAPSYSDQPYPFRDIHDNLHRLYDAFGPARWFWGTDITRMPCPWRQCVMLFTEELPWLKGRDLELVMGRAVCDWLGWER